MKKVILLVFLIVFFNSKVSATLGFSPAFQEFNFEPGKEITATFRIIADDPQQKVSLSLSGDLVEYANLSVQEAYGGESVSVILKLPLSIETPGQHSVSVTASEIPKSRQALGTLIKMSVPVRINVPYPGKYVEAKLTIPNGNINEKIYVVLYAKSKGTESVILIPKIDFYTVGQLVHTITFAPKNLETSEENSLEAVLNTTGFKPGDYEAKAIVEYGGNDAAVADANFRIGSLFVNVTNFTTHLEKGGVQKFFIDVESRWNSNLDNVFAEVNLSNASMDKPIYFKTPSIDLQAWEKKRLEGFLDTSGMNGKYETAILLSYGAGRTLVNGNLFVGKSAEINFVLIGGIIGAVLVILIVFFFLRKKWKNIKRK